LRTAGFTPTQLVWSFTMPLLPLFFFRSTRTLPKFSATISLSNTFFAPCVAGLTAVVG
jgi:hypothetical protein